MEETGHGGILSDEFLDWRLGLPVTGNGTVMESESSGCL